MDAPHEFPLRPLGIGEIFDRAVTIYVRYFVVFTLMMLTLLAPVGVVRIFLMPNPDDYAKLIASMGKATGTLPPNFWSWYGGLFAVGMVVLILTPFVTNAVALGVANLYTGHTPSYGGSFQAVLGRWAPLMGTALLNLLMLFGTYLLAVFLITIIVVIGVAFVQAALPLAVVAFIIGGLLFVAYLLFLAVMVVAYSFSLYGSTIERQSVTAAIGAGYGRIFNKHELKKATLVALAFMGLNVGVTVLSGSVSFFMYLVVKNTALTVVVETLVSAMFYSFTTILLAVYYYDVRTRAEGLDLEVDLARLTTAL